jgi:nucleoside-diphosphate-sugar epimerase
MDIFVIGATGFVGGAAARHLPALGHTVSGLARSAAAARALSEQGIVAVRGDLEEGRAAVVASVADAVIVAAQLDPTAEQVLVDELLDAHAGTGRTLLLTSGTGVFLQRTGGAWSEDVYAEDDPFEVEPLARQRFAVEQAVRRGGRLPRPRRSGTQPEPVRGEPRLG